MQLHYSARILLLLHRPSLGGLDGFIEQQAALAKYADIICGIATTLTDDASRIMSSQCLFIGTCSIVITILMLTPASRNVYAWHCASPGGSAIDRIVSSANELANQTFRGRARSNLEWHPKVMKDAPQSTWPSDFPN
jgi:hypothetical protein